MKTFRLTEDHLKLLRRMNVGWQQCEYGAPEIDCKRPYGNSSVWLDVAEILGWPISEEGDEEGTAATKRRADAIHAETATALQIVLRFAGLKVEPGLYAKANEYDYRTWEMIEP